MKGAGMAAALLWKPTVTLGVGIGVGAGMGVGEVERKG